MSLLLSACISSPLLFLPVYLLLSFSTCISSPCSFWLYIFSFLFLTVYLPRSLFFLSLNNMPFPSWLNIQCPKILKELFLVSLDLFLSCCTSPSLHLFFFFLFYKTVTVYLLKTFIQLSLDIYCHYLYCIVGLWQCLFATEGLYFLHEASPKWQPNHKRAKKNNFRMYITLQRRKNVQLFLLYFLWYHYCINTLINTREGLPTLTSFTHINSASFRTRRLCSHIDSFSIHMDKRLSPFFIWLYFPPWTDLRLELSCLLLYISKEEKNGDSEELNESIPQICKDQ